MTTLLVASEVDRMLRFPRGRALRLAREGSMPAIFLPGDEIRFDAETLTAWLKRQTAGAQGVPRD